jgi:type II secretory ATPase GspE/PulE/Tfp pilus assembly ATPase PilB-like protein
MFGKKKKQAANESPEQIAPDVEFKGMGAATEQDNQTNAIKARQSPGIVPVSMLIGQAIERKASRILLDYTAEGVALRLDMDGFWHDLPAMDRQTGDVMLAVMKKLGDLDPSERQARQAGEFKATFHRVSRLCQITSQGVETGERVIIRMVDPKQEQMSLEDLGMREAVAEQFKQRVGRATGEEMPPPPKGIYVFSAPPNGGGLSALWVAGLMATDRYTGDFLGLEEKTRREPEVENVDVFEFDEGEGETAASVIPKIMLRQPDVLAVPHIADTESLDLLCQLAEDEGTVTITCTRAKSAAEALCKITAATQATNFVKFVNLVVNMRLVRRLCEGCKTPFPPNPQILNQLGLSADRVQVLYQQWEPPPPSEDGKGKDDPPPICPHCAGIGYMGRIGMFELLVVDDNIRQALAEQPNQPGRISGYTLVGAIQDLAVEAGMRTIREEGIALIAQGITSIPELQRALK